MPRMEQVRQIELAGEMEQTGQIELAGEMEQARERKNAPHGTGRADEVCRIKKYRCGT